jgi:Zn-dependent protease
MADYDPQSSNPVEGPPPGANADQPPIARAVGARAVCPVDLAWTDVNGQNWQIRLEPQRVIFQLGDRQHVCPADRWPIDLQVDRSGTSVVVRLDTFECSAGFLLNERQAVPFLKHLAADAALARSVGPVGTAGPVGPVDHVDTVVGDEPRPRARAMFWPKVAPAAIGALSCSVLVFLPGIGPLLGIVVLLLLLRHRGKVPRTAAYRHSRVMCRVAAVLALLGLGVSAVSSVVLWQNFHQGDVLSGDLFSVPAGVADPESGDVAPPIFEPANDGHIPADDGQRDPDIEEGSILPPALAQAKSLADRNWGLIAAGLLVLLFSLSVHEAAHAISAWWMGDNFAQGLGRVTLNPLAHIDLFGTVILPVILFLSNGPVFGFAKAVPTMPHNTPHPRRSHIYISLAGPGSNLLLAAISLMLLVGLGSSATLWLPEMSVANFGLETLFDPVEATGGTLAQPFALVATLLKLSFLLNTFLAFFNLIPIPPLDGSWVLEHLFPNSIGRLIARIRPFGFFAFLLLIFTGLFQYLIWPMLLALVPAIFLVELCTRF